MKLHSAKLVHITPDAEKLIAFQARVSSKDQTNPKIDRLLRYCLDHGHVSIFEMANMCVEITTTRAISPQILRHRSFCVGGDTQIYSISTEGDITTYRIADLAEKGETSLPLLYFDEEECEFKPCKALDVWQSGYKRLFNVRLWNGLEMQVTKDHKFLTLDGWKTLEDGMEFSVAYRTLTGEISYSPIASVTPLPGARPVYDISMDNEFHNFVGNGIVLHNCFQELSLRYANPEEVGYEPLPTLLQSAMDTDWRLQDVKNRQNSIEPDINQQKELSKFTSRFADLAKIAQDLYEDMLQYGVAKECARGVLPLNQPTRLYMNGTIRSWIHYLQVRTKPDVQKEHRLIAQSILEIFKEQLPTIHKALS